MLGQEASTLPAQLSSTCKERVAPHQALEHNNQKPSVHGFHVHFIQERSCFIHRAAKQYKIRGGNQINSQSSRRQYVFSFELLAGALGEYR